MLALVKYSIIKVDSDWLRGLDQQDISLVDRFFLFKFLAEPQETSFVYLTRIYLRELHRLYVE